ncbi:hypothetical protein [Spirosoma endbachense]|uniref:Uncharacterized protein n=1 Tax=Spirosoma endbachense TaxID=2666025 RepID=A0A6P1W071_9BACT|nr:hypothetical protein [Spirosoma endbachense]QHV97978.1 hypothetical protein GJR95_24510 [Spirosoma endbachense]
MNKPALYRQKPDRHFIERITSAKSVLLNTRWKSRFLELNPDWDNAKDLDYLQRVYIGRTADVFVTEELERIAEEFKATNNSPVNA